MVVTQFFLQLQVLVADLVAVILPLTMWVVMVGLVVVVLTRGLLLVVRELLIKVEMVVAVRQPQQAVVAVGQVPLGVMEYTISRAVLAVQVWQLQLRVRLSHTLVAVAVGPTRELVVLVAQVAAVQAVGILTQQTEMPIRVAVAVGKEVELEFLLQATVVAAW